MLLIETQNPSASEQESEPQSGWLRSQICPDCVPAQRLPSQNTFLDRTHGLPGEVTVRQLWSPRQSYTRAKEEKPSPVSTSAFAVVGPLSMDNCCDSGFTPGKDHSLNPNGFVFSLTAFHTPGEWLQSAIWNFKVKTSFSCPSAYSRKVSPLETWKCVRQVKRCYTQSCFSII